MKYKYHDITVNRAIFKLVHDQFSLEHFSDPTDEIIIMAINEKSSSFLDVIDPSDRVVDHYLNLSYHHLANIENPTVAQCKIAININSNAYLHIPSHCTTEELAFLAVQEDSYLLSYIREHQSPRVCLAAVSDNGLMLGHVVNQTDEIVSAAVAQNGDAAKYINHAQLFSRMIEETENE